MSRSAFFSAWLNISPNNCPIHKNIFVISKNINMNIDSIIPNQMKQVQSCAALVGGFGGCLVTSVLPVAACPPLGQCPLWCLFGVLGCTLGP